MYIFSYTVCWTKLLKRVPYWFCHSELEGCTSSISQMNFSAWVLMLLLFDWFRPIGLSLLCQPSRCMYIIMSTSIISIRQTLYYFFKHCMLRSETGHLQVRKQKKPHCIYSIHHRELQNDWKLLTFLCLVFKTFALKHLKIISYWSRRVVFQRIIKDCVWLKLRLLTCGVLSQLTHISSRD